MKVKFILDQHIFEDEHISNVIQVVSNRFGHDVGEFIAKLSSAITPDIISVDGDSAMFLASFTSAYTTELKNLCRTIVEYEHLNMSIELTADEEETYVIGEYEPVIYLEIKIYGG